MNKRATLTVLAVLFFGPVIAAYVWFFHLGEIRPGTVNRGDLVEPPVSLAELDIRFASSEVESSPFTDDWSIVHVVADTCSPACTETLHTTRQVWRRLNKDMNRVQRYLLLSQDASLPELSDEHPNLKILRGDARSIATFADAAGAGRVYLVDPQGFLMMSYPVPLEPELLYKDLQRLLKYSQADAVQ